MTESGKKILSELATRRIHTELSRKKRSEASLRERNPQWKGLNVDISYNQLHERIKWYYPKTELCQNCKTSPSHDLACITGIYNMDLINWMWVCKSCHVSLDGLLHDPISGRFIKRTKNRGKEIFFNTKGTKYIKNEFQKEPRLDDATDVSSHTNGTNNIG